MGVAVLIPSHRHTAADLALWREYEQSDVVHYQALCESGAIDRSLDALKRLTRQQCYTAFSGGKDSLTVLGLLHECGILESIPVFWFCADPKHNPDAGIAVAAASEHFGINIEVIQYESPVPLGMSSEAAERLAGKAFMSVCRDTAGRYGKAILGLRADESRQRLLRCARYGLETSTSIAPLAWWKLPDVYAYAAVKSLPLCSVYGMLGGGRYDRSDLRVDALMGFNGDGRGRAEWEKDYYQDVINRLLAQATRNEVLQS